MSDERRTASDTIPMSRAELNAALLAHGCPPIPEEYETRTPPCAACSAAALALDSNDELVDYDVRTDCRWCHGSGSMTPAERIRYLDSQER